MADAAASSMTDEDIREKVVKAAHDAFVAKEQAVGPENFGQFERIVLLQSLDTHWREHLAALDHLRQGIHLRGYAQKDPKQEYKKEGFVIFGEMMASISRNLCQKLFHIQIRRDESEAAAQQMADKQARRRPRDFTFLNSFRNRRIKALAAKTSDSRLIL